MLQVNAWTIQRCFCRKNYVSLWFPWSNPILWPAKARI